MSTWKGPVRGEPETSALAGTSSHFVQRARHTAGGAALARHVWRVCPTSDGKQLEEKKKIGQPGVGFIIVGVLSDCI